MKNLNTFVHLSITRYTTHPSLNTGWKFVSTELPKKVTCGSISYEEAKKQIVKIAVKYNMKIYREPNQFEPSIITYGIHGFLD